MARTEIVGLILAGGLARRMGGRDKAFLPFAGSDLVHRAVARLSLQCDRVIINANGERYRFAALELPVVSDTVAGFAGPLAGILAGLDWLATHVPTARLLSVPVDGPFFPDDLAARLEGAADAQGVTAACAQSGGRRHGVYALWPVGMREELRRALTVDGLRKVDTWLAQHDVAVAEWPTQPFDPFFNVNTPDDLARAEQHLQRLASGA
jgi:molybdopterin-guanine dinucleotide biosynthesis protein A